MVHAPAANGIRESRHVAVYGLPQTLTDENLQRHFGRFGPIQGLSRLNKDCVLITFMDTRSAGVACKSETQYDKDTTYRITYYNSEPSHRHSMASLPSTPTFPPQISSPRHSEDHRPPQRSQIERSRTVHHHPPPPPPPQPRDSVENWTAPIFPHPEYIVCVVYEIQFGTTPEKEVWTLVKERAKKGGDVANITISTVAPGVKRFTAFYTKTPNVEILNGDPSLLLGKPPLQKVFFSPASNGCQPSTSNGHKLSEDEVLRGSISIHVKCPKNENKEKIAHKYQKYGHIVDVEIVPSTVPSDNSHYAVVQFNYIENAYKALKDGVDDPNIMQYHSRSSNRLIISHIPAKMSDEEVMFYIRRINDQIAEIDVDWVERRAVVTLETMEAARKVIKIMRPKIPPPNKTPCQYPEPPLHPNFGNYKVNVDYCTERFYREFLDKKEVNKSAKKRREQSWSRDQENRRESIGPKSSVDEVYEDDEINEASSSNNVNISGSSIEDDEDGDDDPRRIASGSRKFGESEDQDMIQLDDDSLPGPSHDSDDLKQKMEVFEPDPEPEGESQAQPRDEPPQINGTRSHDELSRRVSQPSTSYGGDSRKHFEERVKRSSSFMPILPRTFDKEPKEEIKMENSLSPINRPVHYYKLFCRGPRYKNCLDDPLSRNLDRLINANTSTKAKFEKMTGRPFPHFGKEDELRSSTQHVRDSRNYYRENSDKDIDIRMREWKKQQAMTDRRVQEYQIHDYKELTQSEKKDSIPHPISNSSGRPSMDESVRHRLSFDATHHPGDLTQRSQSLCIGPQTPSTPYPQPLLVNTNQHPGFSQPSGSGITTPRTTQPPTIPMSPVSRHNSMSSTGRPANIQTLRHQSVILPDLSVPPPSFTPFQDDHRTISTDPTSSRRSSETLVPLKSPPFVNIPNLMTMPPTSAQMAAATGTHSVSSSAHSTPRHSISGTPVHYEPPTTSKGNQAPTPKSSRPEKVQVRHDSISKPGPSNAANALQARSQSMTGGDPRRSTPSTPVVRDAGSDLIAQIMSNEPSQRFKKLPRIEKKPSALQNVHSGQNSNPSVTTPTTPSGSLNQAMLLKDKEKEKERRRKEKERELEKEREARKEMKKKETKEERHKRKEMERKREEDERRERKREKQRIKEKEERRKEKEKERRKAEKEKLKKKKHRKDEDSDDSESTSDDELDLDRRKSAKEMTQEEKDHQLAMILSRGSIIENLKSRRRTDKRGHDSLDKIRKDEQAGTPRRVLIESSDDDNGKDDDDDKKHKSDSSSGEASDAEPHFLQPPSVASASQEKEHKHHNKPNHKEREKGELSSSSSEDEENQQSSRKKKIKEDRENRKRQKSLTNYSSDEHSRKNNGKKAKKEETENAVRNNSHKKKEDANHLRKRKGDYTEAEPKAKKPAIRQTPSLEIVDISDTELTPASSVEEEPKADRIRRQSSSSISSGKNEKHAKTPLRVVAPATSETPLQSPKILSPKLISPKPSSSKRPSITAESPVQEKSLVSPRPRNRTTSSTSSTTSSSKREVSVVPEVRPSPPVTAKTSVSSIEDFSTREEFNSSAAASPMSATGKPMVLTKAAMKAFHSSPPKKQSNSSGPHDSSDSDSSSSSSGSSSSEDDSDDENAAIVEQIVNSTTPIVLAPVVPPVVIEQEIAEEPVQEEITVTSPPPATQEEVVVEEQVVEEQPVVQEEVVGSPEAQEPLEDDKEVEKISFSEIVESTEVVEPEKETFTVEKTPEDPAVEIEKEQEGKVVEVEEDVQNVEPEKIPSPVRQEPEPTSDFPSSKQMERKETSSSPSAHTIISDQETNQAVQSIFDEEEDDEAPQYPDFVMPNDDKMAPGKDAPKPASIGKKSSRSTMSSDRSSVDTLMSPKTSTSQVEKMSEDREESFERDQATSVDREPAPSAEEPKQQETQYMSDSDDEFGDKPLEIAEERTPTPELVPAEKAPEKEPTPEKIQEATPEPSQVSPIIENQEALVQEPLEVVVPSHQHQVIQPSPRPAVTPISAQPVSVVQPPQPSPVTAKSDNQLVIELLSAGRLDEVAKRMNDDPTFRDRIDPQTIQLLQKMFCLHAETSTSTVAEKQKLQAEMMAQHHHELAARNAQVRQELLKNYKEDENLKRQQREQLDRKMEMDRQEKKRRGDTERMTMANAQKAAAMAAAQALQNAQQQGQKPNAAFLMSLMPAEARSLYGQVAGRIPAQPPLVNGSSSSQLTPRPSSNASSTTSVRTPLASVNQIPRSEEGTQFQRWFYNVSLNFLFLTFHI